MPSSFGDDPFQAGQSTSIQCIVILGDSPLSIDWLVNGETVSPNEDILISKITSKLSLLSIDSVSARHVGNYTCVARNQAGISSFTTQLLVNGLLLFFF